MSVAAKINDAMSALQQAQTALLEARALLTPPTPTDAALHDVVVQVALMADDAGHAIQRRRRPAIWVLNEMHSRLGRRIALETMRDCLEDENHRPNARIAYRRHDPHGRGKPAGWIRKVAP